MTWLELAKGLREYVEFDDSDRATHCPTHLHGCTKPEYCRAQHPCEIFGSGTCRDCWSREVPEEVTRSILKQSSEGSGMKKPMTCREKMAMEHPTDTGSAYLGGCIGCPHDHGYLDKPEYCPQVNGNMLGDNELCTKCWDREIPEELILAVDDLYSGKTEVICPTILDSGERREFESGAVRDIQEDKGRCDLLPMFQVGYFLRMSTSNHRADDVFGWIGTFQQYGDVKYLYRALKEANPWGSDAYTMILEVAKQFEGGAVKYGDRNWEKGIPVRCYIDSAIRHYLKYLRGDKDEPHDRAFCWNILCAIWTCKNIPELNEYRREKVESGDE